MGNVGRRLFKFQVGQIRHVEQIILIDVDFRRNGQRGFGEIIRFRSRFGRFLFRDFLLRRFLYRLFLLHRMGRLNMFFKRVHRFRIFFFLHMGFLFCRDFDLHPRQNIIRIGQMGIQLFQLFKINIIFLGDFPKGIPFLDDVDSQWASLLM